MRCLNSRVEFGDVARFPDGRVDVVRPWPHGQAIVVAQIGSTCDYYAVRGNIADLRPVTRETAIKAGFDPDAPRP